jgi:hypothetical protein
MIMLKSLKCKKQLKNIKNNDYSKCEFRMSKLQSFSIYSVISKIVNVMKKKRNSY